jgi:hypothetical protein
MPGFGMVGDGSGLGGGLEGGGLRVAGGDEEGGGLELEGGGLEPAGSGLVLVPGVAVTVTVLVSGTTAGGAVAVTVTRGRTVPDAGRTVADGFRWLNDDGAAAGVSGPGACLAVSAAWSLAWPPVAMATVMRTKQAASVPYRTRRSLAAVARPSQGQADARLRGLRFRACPMGSCQSRLPGL